MFYICSFCDPNSKVTPIMLAARTRLYIEILFEGDAPRQLRDQAEFGSDDRLLLDWDSAVLTVERAAGGGVKPKSMPWFVRRGG